VTATEDGSIHLCYGDPIDLKRLDTTIINGGNGGSMAKKKKISRKKLLKEPDEFITISARMIQYGTKYKTHLIVGVIAFFVLVISGSAYRYISQRGEAAASSLLQQSLSVYDRVHAQGGPAQALNAVKSDFDRLLDDYSGKEAARNGRVIYASICLKGGDTETAIRLYELALKDFIESPAIEGRILSSLGYGYETKKDYEKAVGYFQRVVEGSGYLMKDEALFNLGRLYARLGENSKSKASYQRIVSDQPESLYVELAREKLAGS
jgi:tetratricopeptide (TPR) repeat protein